MRITRDKMLMGVAELMSKRSTCLRAQVGAVLAHEGRVISSGYAGAPKGLPHCHPGICSVDQPCLRTVHAEAGAISYAARFGIKTDGATLYCTLSPCIDCAKLIINSGIKEVVYGQAYRKTEGIEQLREAGIFTRLFEEKL